MFFVVVFTALLFFLFFFFESSFCCTTLWVNKFNKMSDWWQITFDCSSPLMKIILKLIYRYKRFRCSQECFQSPRVFCSKVFSVVVWCGRLALECSMVSNPIAWKVSAFSLPPPLPPPTPPPPPPPPSPPHLFFFFHWHLYTPLTHPWACMVGWLELYIALQSGHCHLCVFSMRKLVRRLWKEVFCSQWREKKRKSLLRLPP